MSIKIMERVFKDENLDPNKKLIMLALGDNSNDEGFCYPAINNICKKTSLSKPTVIKHIKELELNGLLLSKQRNRKDGSRTTKIYLIYPNENMENLDDDLKEKFAQSKEALPPSQSKEALPPNGGQSKEALPLEPSLTLFNHHLFNKLNKEEKNLFLEYLALRKSMKLKTTMKIQDRLLHKYFEYGRVPDLIQNAINSNWKDFYPPKNINTAKTNNQQPQQQQKDPFDLYTFYRQKGMAREVAETRVISETGLKYPATDRFLKAVANAEYEWSKQQRPANQNQESDEDYAKRMLGEL